MKFQRTPLLEKCWTFTQKTVSAHRKQVSSAAGNWTFWQHFVNIENLLNGTMDFYKIWWQYSKYIKACARNYVLRGAGLHLPEPNVNGGHFLGHTVDCIQQSPQTHCYCAFAHACGCIALLIVFSWCWWTVVILCSVPLSYDDMHGSKWWKRNTSMTLSLPFPFSSPSLPPLSSPALLFP